MSLPFFILNFHHVSTPPAPVNIEEFEQQYQASVSQILNELQSMAIISNRLESSIVEVGTSVQKLNKMVEDFLIEQERKATVDKQRMG